MIITQYYGTRLSENISLREPEGYLLCLNVPVARTGVQEYLPEELNLPRRPDPVPVFRPEEEVFSPETVASFEGMPVTDEHPAEGVTAGNIRSLQKGHAHNVRRGSGNESDLLLADLIVTDPELIRRILAGKREISCGYTYELCEENGRYIQRKIRGNHVAVVGAGRAGRRVSIRDHRGAGGKSPAVPKARPEPSSPVPAIPTETIERSQPAMDKSITTHSLNSQFPASGSLIRKSLLKKLTRMARDGDPEAVEALAEAVEAIMENPSADPDAGAVVIAAETEPAPAENAEPAEEPAALSDSDTLSAILERLDQLVALLSAAAPAADEDPGQLPDDLAEAVGEAVEEAVQAAEDPEEAPNPVEEIAAAVEEILSPAVSTVLEPDEDPGEPDNPPCETGDALRAALQAVRPALRRMSRKERSRVCMDIAARLKKTGADSGAYSALLSAGSRPSANPADLGKRIMATRNPNYK